MSGMSNWASWGRRRVRIRTGLSARGEAVGGSPWGACGNTDCKYCWRRTTQEKQGLGAEAHVRTPALRLCLGFLTCRSGRFVSALWGGHEGQTGSSCLWVSQTAVVKNPPANAGGSRDAESIPESRRSLGAGNGSPLQYSCLENPKDRGAWQAAAHGVAKSQTRVNDWALGLTQGSWHRHTPQLWDPSHDSGLAPRATPSRLNTQQPYWKLSKPLLFKVPGAQSPLTHT